MLSERMVHRFVKFSSALSLAGFLTQSVFRDSSDSFWTGRVSVSGTGTAGRRQTGEIFPNRTLFFLLLLGNSIGC